MSLFSRCWAPLCVGALWACSPAAQPTPDCEGRWETLQIPGGDIDDAEVVGAGDSTYVVFTRLGQDGNSAETRLLRVGDVSDELIDVSPSPAKLFFERRVEGYSAIHGHQLVLSVSDSNAQYRYWKSWSPLDPLRLRDLFVCNHNSGVIASVGYFSGQESWVQRTESVDCNETVAPFRAVRCPYDTLGLFKAGDPSIHCPFGDAEVAPLAREHPALQNHSAMHPLRRLGSFNQIAFFGFDEAARLTGMVLSADGGAAEDRFSRYFDYPFLPVVEDPPRRVGVGYPDYSLEVVSWLDGGLRAEPLETEQSIKRLRGAVLTSRGVLLHGRTHLDGPASDQELFLLLDRDAKSVIERVVLTAPGELRVVESGGKLVVYQLRWARGQNRSVRTVSYQSLPSAEGCSKTN